jgi:hypothetical protein
VALTILLSAALMLALVLWLPLGMVLVRRLTSLESTAVRAYELVRVSPSPARSLQPVDGMGLLPQRAPPAELLASLEERFAPSTFPVRRRRIEPGEFSPC